MMAWLLLWTMGVMASTALSLTVTIPEDSGLSIVEGEKRGPVEIVKKDSHPVLIRQKRHWIWNALYVQEENPVTTPLKIGQLKSSKKVDGRRFEIRGEGANSIFTVDDKGDLFVTTSLDREVKSVYHLTAMMFDRNNRLVEPAESFEVQVTDINDHIPSFPNTINATVMERSETGSEVGTVKATDADDPSTRNADLRYSLIQGGETFEIDSDKGRITCKTNNLDRETKGLYVVIVQAKDMSGMVTGSTATASVTITIADINDNIVSFTQNKYSLQVPENHRLNEKFGILELEDKDLDENKEPRFTIPSDANKTFKVEVNSRKNGNLMLNQALDYETKSSYTFTINVDEDMTHLRSPPDNKDTAITTAQVHIRVTDVDEPPVFSKLAYDFKVEEGSPNKNIGTVTAKDPDAANDIIRYSILDKDCPISIHRHTGQLSTLTPLDREEEAIHVFQVKAQEELSGLESFVRVSITVTDINDNKPELDVDEIYVCENDVPNTVIGILGASDRDEQPASFSFKLDPESSNFTVIDYKNNTAALIVKQGGFSLDDPNDYHVYVSISDGGQSSNTRLTIKLCRCDDNRVSTQCKASARRMSVSVHALVAILLCILTILVIVILFVLRKRYQEDSLASMKNSGEIHEQLVTYDEEGGGEMDTNGYDVSILSSACHDGSLLRHPDARHAHPSLYAMVQKPPPPPTACKGDMAAMIEVKKDEADHDRDGFPYDTLHIYGYEGPESLAGSLSSVESSSTASNLDYDFLNDWGPRFKNLAELYGVDGPEYYHQY